MGIALPNVVPITINDVGTLAPFWGPFQSIELHEYTSPAGAMYLAPAHRAFEIVSGSPPGLSISAGDGVVSGTIESCTSSEALIDAITDFPDDKVSLASYITESCTVEPSDYLLGDVVEIIYEFATVVITGIWDMPVGSGTVPIPVTKTFTIKILKSFTNDAEAWEAIPDE